MLFESTVRHLVMQRQFLDKKVDRSEYKELFRLMSPVQPRYWTRPGSPPELTFRAGFIEQPFVFDMRSRREIVKGRFQGGLIGYILADELALFDSVYAKDRSSLSYEELELLDLLETEGPMNIAAIKDITGWLSKQITPVLHKLQQKFLVYEDQVDSEWDRAWYLFESEFPDVDLKRIDRNAAIEDLLMRFVRLNVFIDDGMIRSFYKLKPAQIKTAVSSLVSKGKLREVIIRDRQGYAQPEDIPLFEKDLLPSDSIYVLHRNDFLVRSHEDDLKKRFHHADLATLFYILINGEFKGCIFGNFRNNTPFDIEDIVLDTDKSEASALKDRILEAISLVHESELNPVKRYCGQPL